MKMLRYAFVIFVLNLSIPLFAQEIEDNQLLWVARPTATDSLASESASMTLDSEGNIYICGGFKGIKDFGGGHILSSKKYDGFVAKYSPQGTILWARQTYTPGTFIQGRNHLTAGMSSMDSDKDGNLYILGAGDTVNFGNGVTLNLRESIYSSLNFLAKYDKDGGVLWAKRITLSNGGEIKLHIDANSNIYFSGDYIYNDRYDKNGNRILDNTVSFGRMSANYLATDSDNNIILAGAIYANSFNPELDGITFKYKGLLDAYIMKHDSKGKAIWAVTIGGDSAFCRATSVAADSSGNIYLTGEFNQPINFGNGIILESNFSPNSQSRDFFIAKFNADGQVQWAKKIKNSTNIGTLGTITNIAVDNKGYIYTNGYMYDTLDFGNGHIITSTTGNTFIAIFNSLGEVLQIRKTGDRVEYALNITSMKLDNKGNIITSGKFASKVNFGKNSVVDIGNNTSAFVAKYAAFTPTSIEENELLKNNSILSIHPNPAHSTSRISFKTTAPSHTRLTLTDVLGRQTLLKEETLDAGEHSAEINTANFPAGIYVLTLEAEGQVLSQTVVIER